MFQNTNEARNEAEMKQELVALQAAFFSSFLNKNTDTDWCQQISDYSIDSCSSYNPADNHAIVLGSTASTQKGWGVLVFFFNTPKIFALLLRYTFDGLSNTITMLLIRNAFLSI